MFNIIALRPATRGIVIRRQMAVCQRAIMLKPYRQYSKSTNTDEANKTGKDDEDGLLTHRIRQRREININEFNKELGEGESTGTSEESDKKKKYNFFQKWLLIGLIGAMAGTTYFKSNYGPTHKSGRQPAETLEMRLTQLAMEELEKKSKSNGMLNEEKASPPLLKAEVPRSNSTLIETNSDNRTSGLALPVQEPEELQVSFLLYPPGSKVPELKNICSAAGYTYLDPKDLIMNEIKSKEESEYGLLLQDIISQNKKIPEELVGVIVRKAVLMQSLDESKFVIGGFPTSLAQAQKFDETVGSISKVLFFDLPVVGDNNQALVEAYIQQSGPIIDYFQKNRKMVMVQTEKDFIAALNQ